MCVYCIMKNFWITCYIFTIFASLCRSEMFSLAFVFFFKIYNGILLSLKKKKEGSLVICKDMGEPEGYCAKWNKRDTRQILHDIT